MDLVVAIGSQCWSKADSTLDERRVNGEYGLYSSHVRHITLLTQAHGCALLLYSLCNAELFMS